MNLKKLQEQRATFVTELNEILEKAKKEERAISNEENEKFNELENKIKSIDLTMEAEKRARELEITEAEEKKTGKKAEGRVEERAEAETRAFENYLRGKVEERADTNLTAGDNGAVIPSSIANKIIKRVYDISPVYQMATRYNIGGTLNIPYYDEETQKIEMEYATEFAELESTSGKFTSIELKGYLAGALSKISKSLMNNSQFDIVSFVINAMAETISKWIEKELIQGTADKIDGLSKAKQAITSQSATVITMDELIDTQEEIPDVYQGGCVWIMNKKTRTAIRKLKDGEGNYILNKDATSRWGYTLLGKDVYTTDSVEKMEAGKKTIFYGDLTALAVKISENVSIEVLREKYATQHAVGIVAWLEMDAKVENEQKMVWLKMANA